MAQIFVEYRGKKVEVTKQKLFEAAAKGLIGPETRIWHGDQESTAGKIAGIQFSTAANPTPQSTSPTANSPQNPTPTAPQHQTATFIPEEPMPRASSIPTAPINSAVPSNPTQPTAAGWTVEYQGRWVPVTREKLFEVAAQGLVTPASRLRNGTQETTVGAIPGIRFPNATASFAAASAFSAGAQNAAPNNVAPNNAVPQYAVPRSTSSQPVRAAGESRTHRAIFVLLGGLFTSAISLVAVYFIGNLCETDPLSITLWDFLPISAILIGAVAGSGYAVVCRLLHYRASYLLIGGIFAIQILVFLGGRYAGYLSSRNAFLSSFNEAMVTVFDGGVMSDENLPDESMSDESLLGEGAAAENPTDANTTNDQSTEETSAAPAAPTTPAANEAPTPEKPTDTPDAAPDADAAQADSSAATESSEESADALAGEDEEEGEPISLEELLPALADSYPGFWSYYRDSITSAVMSELTVGEPKEAGKELGKLGYLYELLFMLAFCVASTFGLLTIVTAAYCRNCNKYMRKVKSYRVPNKTDSDVTMMLAAGPSASTALPGRRVNVNAVDRVRDLRKFLRSPSGGTNKSAREVLDKLAELFASDSVPKSALSGVPNWVEIIYSECPDCPNWELVAEFRMNGDDAVANRAKPRQLLKAGREIPVTGE